ncbi:MAG TPA: oligosaccharide flippase family protein [Terriglobales bacterium]|nr:oligosaccharide flippase family protein [Terriglobales bacterium]
MLLRYETAVWAGPQALQGAAVPRSLVHNPLLTRGSLYLTARYGLGILINLGNMLVMTWWIGPRPYGIFVMAIGITTLFSSVSRCGVDSYLIRCDETPDRKQYDVAATVALGISAAVCLIGVFTLPLLKAWYSEPGFVLPYLVLLACVPLTALVGIPTAKLERDLKFEDVARIELGGQVLAFLSAAVLAYRGCGVWAPVVGIFVWQAFAFGAACHASGFFPHLKFDRGDARRMLAVGFGISASARIWQLRTLVNPLIVVRFAGAEGVAYVALALRAAESLAFVRTAAARFGFAALSRLQHVPSLLCATLQRALVLQVVTLGPLLCAFAYCGPWLIPHCLGQRWTAAMPVYPLVAIGVLLSSIVNLQAAALLALGFQWTVLWAYGVHVILLAMAAWLLVPHIGIIGYGLAEVLACSGYLVIPIGLDRVLKLSYSTLFGAGFVFLLALLVQTMRLCM